MFLPKIILKIFYLVKIKFTKEIISKLLIHFFQII